MSNQLILSGTSEELKSPRALKILAACVYAGVPLIRKESTNNAQVGQVTPTSTAEGAMVLCYGETTRIATTTAALRLVASLAPGANLQGASAIEHAVTDAWLSFLGSSVELPLQAMMAQQHAQISKDWKDALTKLNQHLTFQTYMVGQAGVTLADIRLLVSLYTAVNAGVWDVNAAADADTAAAESEETNNLVRWYQTMTHQEWFTTSVNSLATISAAPVGGAASAATASNGIQLNGPAPAVVGNLYRRHRIRIKEVVKNEGNDYLDQSITVAGWARTTRNANKGQLLFVELSDGSSGSSLQCVLDSETSEGFDECKASGGTGASFQFIGKLIPSQGDGQAVELQVTTGKLLGAVYGGNAEGTEVGGKLYPMAKKEHTLEHMREHAHLRARGRVHSAAMRVRHAMAYATHNFFHNHGFLYVHTPIITGADCEGAGEQFGITTMLGSDHMKPGVKVPVHEPPVVAAETEEISKSELKRRKKAADKAASKGPTDPNKLVEEKVVGAVDYTSDFFGQRVNLTVSGQLNVETHACALSDVYTFGPTFRAEMSYTSRHLSEFWMIEPEIAFADLADDINLAEDYLKYCVKFALENCAEDLEFFENNPHGEVGLRDRLRNVLENPFKRLTYTEAIEVLQNAVTDGVVFEEKVVWGMDLPSEMERYICEKVYKMPVVLTDYPKEIKAFYMKLNIDGKTVAAADILVPKIGEIIGGSAREHRLDVLKQRCEEMDLDPRHVWWYLDLRRYGTVPHAGFGLGFERLILFITGLNNIRDVIPFPRWAGNSKF